MQDILAIIVAYCIGSIPTGVIVTKIMGAGDPRSKGSGNIGATNVLRSAGKWAGLVTLLGDCLKGLIPVLFALHFFRADMMISFVAFSAVLGHVLPLFLGFRGGKGVATALGVFLVISPLALLFSFVLFSLILVLFRYVSLASIITAASMPLFLGITMSGHPSFLVLGAAVAVVIIVRHAGNIERLVHGSENRLGRK